jgi:hypothetical protein
MMAFPGFAYATAFGPDIQLYSQRRSFETAFLRGSSSFKWLRTKFHKQRFVAQLEDILRMPG